DEVPLAEITRKWNATYLGWTTTYVGQALKSDPAPSKPKESKPVSTELPHVVTSLGSVRSHTRLVAAEITQKFQPIYFVWGIDPTGEHAQGRALDFMTYELGGGVDSPGPIRLAF